MIYSFQGEGEAAYQCALEGTERGQVLASSFVQAVGSIRQGHALMLLPGEVNFSAARAEYDKAVQTSHSLAVPRLRVEALWGLCRAYGYQGDLERARHNANLAIDIATRAGDEWIASLVRLTMGANLVQAGQYEGADPWLKEAQRGFHECSDPFGSTASRLWLCLSLYHQNKIDRLSGEMVELLISSKEGDYGFLFTRPTLLGPSNVRSLIPLLILAREQNWEGYYARDLLKEIGLPGIHIHPGYQLRVQTLGAFNTWRGSELIQKNGWQRTKSRQLFQLLVTFKGSPLEREQIFEYLWPGAKIESSERNFKVVLSSLYRVLEPDRKPGAGSAYIMREDTRYYLRPEADLWLDVDEFLRLAHLGENLSGSSAEDASSTLEKALALYQGDYLNDSRYEIWAASKREQLSVVYLQAADRLCELYLRSQKPDLAIQLCQKIIAEDNCWERAYRNMMLAYDQLGDHGQIARTFQRCEDILQKELDVSPSPETIARFQDLVGQKS